MSEGDGNSLLVYSCSAVQRTSFALITVSVFKCVIVQFLGELKEEIFVFICTLILHCSCEFLNV